MEEERRVSWDRRKDERRQTGKIIKLTDENFDREMVDIPVFGLALFSSSWSGPCKKLAEVLTQIAQDFKETQRLRTGHFEVSSEKTKMLIKYGVTSIPTLMLFRGGEVVYRTSHFDTEASLRKKINQIIATDTKVFVERRHRDKRREGQRRRYEPLQSVIWRDLKNELHRTPWPVVVSINPEDPVLNEDFASLVESVVEKLRVMGLKALHVTGTPSKHVKRHFGITIDAPGVAVFYEGKLIGQFENIRSGVDLRKRLRSVLP